MLRSPDAEPGDLGRLVPGLPKDVVFCSEPLLSQKRQQMSLLVPGNGLEAKVFLYSFYMFL